MIPVSTLRDGVRINAIVRMGSAQSLAQGNSRKGGWFQWLEATVLTPHPQNFPGPGQKACIGHFSHTCQPHTPHHVFHSYKIGIPRKQAHRVKPHVPSHPSLGVPSPGCETPPGAFKSPGGRAVTSGSPWEWGPESVFFNFPSECHWAANIARHCPELGRSRARVQMPSPTSCHSISHCTEGKAREAGSGGWGGWGLDGLASSTYRAQNSMTACAPPQGSVKALRHCHSPLPSPSLGPCPLEPQAQPFSSGNGLLMA